jgi:hypothetical protein
MESSETSLKNDGQKIRLRARLVVFDRKVLNLGIGYSVAERNLMVSYRRSIRKGKESSTAGGGGEGHIYIKFPVTAILVQAM